MDPHPQVLARVERLAIRLRVEIQAAGSSLAAVSRALHHHADYLGRVLSTPERLKMKSVFEILETMGLHPADFFLRIRPVEAAGYLNDMRTLTEAAAARPLNIDLEGKWTGASEVPRLRHQLRLAVDQAGMTVRQVSLALGYGPNTLSGILRGRAELRVWQVYGVLHEIDLPHEDFFDSLYGLVGGAPDLMLPGGRMWSELRDLIRQLNGQPGGPEEADDEEV